jgi:surfeit locus 1 family protein
MPSLNCFQQRFTPPIWACVLTAVAVLLFSALGYWQLQRAAEKQHILTSLAQTSQQSPHAWQPSAPLPQSYQPLKITGHFLPKVFLLDNQFNQHQLGFQVLSPFQVEHTDNIVLIDRGWIAADPTRQHLPEITTPTQPVTLSGRAYYPSGKQWNLGPAYEIKTPKITLIEHLDLSLISDFLHKSVNPFIIRMAREMPYGYNRTWIAVSTPPERHLGYALQWFVMAAVSVILLISLNIKRTKA